MQLLELTKLGGQASGDFVVEDHELCESGTVADAREEGGHAGVEDDDAAEAFDVAKLGWDGSSQGRVVGDLDVVGECELAQPLGDCTGESVPADVE